MYASGRQRLRLHLVEQPPHPAIGDGRGNQADRLATEGEPSCEFPPFLVVSHQPMSRFDQHRTQLRIAGPEETGVGLAGAAGCVARADSAEASQLLARAEAIEPSNFGP